MARPREQAVQQHIYLPCVLKLAIIALLAVHALGNNTYRDPGAGGVDNGRRGNGTSAHEYNWTVQYMNATRLCSTKPIATVNGQFPGPPIYVREGDTVIIHVTNNIDHNLTLHWHGVRQLLQNWQDGPAYFTQCPIQPGQSFTYNFTINDQKKGTVFWHAHITWLRATLYGAFIILPRENQVYPFRQPQAENTLIFGGDPWISIHK